MSIFVQNNSEVLVRDEPAGPNEHNSFTNGDWCRDDIERQNRIMGPNSRYVMKYGEVWKEVLIDPDNIELGYEDEAFCCIERHLKGDGE
jgi:hypothetical protein